RLAPNVAVPAEFEAWLSRTMAKRPWARFRRAAEARHALLSLDESELIAAATSRSAPRRAAPSGEVDNAMVESPSTEDVITIAVGARGRTSHISTEPYGANPNTGGGAWSGRLGASLYDNEAPPVEGAMPIVRPPLPEHWDDDRASAAISLVGAGLGLFGL